MKSELIEYVHCDLCGSGDYRILPRFYSFQGVDCYHVKCRICGLIYVNPRPKREHLRTFYPPHYFHGSGYVGGLSDSGYPTRFDSILDTIQSSMVYNSALLEVGCADALFLSKALERGWQVKGVEISDYAARYARENRHVDVVTGTLEQVRFCKESFGCVYMGDVLEHLPLPKESLAIAWQVLCHRGVLVIECPLFYNSLYGKVSHLGLLIRLKIIGRAHMMEGPPRHLYEFIPSTLEKLLVLSGYEISKKVYQTQSKILREILSVLPERFEGIFSNRILVYAHKI